MVGTDIIGGYKHNKLRYRLSNIEIQYFQNLLGGWVGGWVGGLFLQEILPLRGSILQVGTCQIFSLAENPRWSRVWKYINVGVQGYLKRVMSLIQLPVLNSSESCKVYKSTVLILGSDILWPGNSLGILCSGKFHSSQQLLGILLFRLCL